MKTMKQTPTVRKRTGLVGLTATARRLGVSPGHLGRVIRGERRSPRLERSLRRMGVELPSSAK